MKNTTVFFRVSYPGPGMVKPKIENEAGFNIARAVYKELIRTTHHHIEKLTDTSNIVMFYEPEDRLSEIKSLLGNMDLDYQVMPKGSKGEVIASCFDYSFSKGTSKVIYSHVDSPTLTYDLIERTSFALNDESVVIGPATNGEMYLFGLNEKAFGSIKEDLAKYEDITVEVATEISKKIEGTTKVYNKEVCIDTLEDWDNYQASLA